MASPPSRASNASPAATGCPAASHNKPVMSVMTDRANVGVLQRLLETLDMAAALAHELLAHPQDVAHLLKSVPPARSCRG